MAQANENKTKTMPDQSLGKAMSLLTKLASTCNSMSVSELADEIKVSRPTAYAIVNTLAAQNYIEKDEITGKYRIGYMFYALGQNYPRLYPFLNYIENIVNEEHRRLGLRINICVFKPPMTALVIATKDESAIPRHSAGLTLPAHLSASGKVLLASLPKKTAEEYIKQSNLYPLTSKTITDAEELLKSIAEARDAGYATDEEEFVPSSACIAAPVYDASGKTICSVSLSRCPIGFFNENRQMLIDAVRDVAMRMSLECGLPRELAYKKYFES